MLRPIFSLIVTAFLLLSAACETPPERAAAEGWISGRVIDVDGKPLQGTIDVGDQRFVTNGAGRFVIAPETAPVYRMEFAVDGYYPMRQTFSHAELMQEDNLADVILVAQKPERTLFVFGGDAMIGRRFYAPFEGEPVLVSPESRLEDSKALLKEMKPYLARADYASINLETPIFETPPSAAAPKSVTFYSGPETLEALEWAGIDYVALGNNHIYDFLEPGLDVTMSHLRASALTFSGAGKTEDEALQPLSLPRQSDTFDFFSYVGWPAGPPTQSAEADKGGAALGTSQNILETTQKSVTAGAIPILQFHGGLEYVEEPTLSVETKLKHAVDAGAALVIGHHPHVVQGLELYQDKLIAWSLGNFLFDQYFYSAQSAALLYVWMDGEEFHHAEAVPIYIKGYHPTPAVGPMRNEINRRLTELSAQRGTRLYRSGGHMSLSRVQRSEKSSPKFDRAIDCSKGNKRTGLDLLARGDFDAHDLFGAADRSWLDLDPRVRILSGSENAADKHMQINLPADDAITTGMRKFLRVFTPGTPMSVRADLVATADVDMDVYLQVRATGQSLEDALQNGRLVRIGTQKLIAGEAVKLDLDFDSPRTRARSIRVLIEIRSGARESAIELDNFELIEWQTPFESRGGNCGP